MNDLAITVDEFINSKGIKKVWIYEQLGISQAYFYKLMHKKNFTIEDANRILAPLGYKISYQIDKVQNEQK